MKVHDVLLIDEDDEVVLSYKAKGKYENDSLVFWKHSLTKDNVAVDVGAYTGLYSIVAAKYGSPTLAFEPVKNIYTRLLQNMVQNNVIFDARNCAIVQDGIITDIYMRHKRLDSKSSVIYNEFNLKESILSTDRMGFLAYNVGIIKIDTVGSEMHVLTALHDIIREQHPKLIMSAITDRDKETISNHLNRLDYKISVADSRNLLCW